MLRTATCITSPSRRDNTNINFAHHTNSLPFVDWEPGLREATYQALLRERYTYPNLKDHVFDAPLENRQDTAFPFGDITVLGRGQLISTYNGLKFTQDTYQNDCDDCHNTRYHCPPSRCHKQRLHARDDIIALWTIKRIRHRDPVFGHRYDLQYTIAPLDGTNGFLPDETGYDYNTPGHIFILKTQPALTQPTNQREGYPYYHSTQVPNSLYTEDYNGYNHNVPSPGHEKNHKVEETTHQQVQSVPTYQTNGEHTDENHRAKEVQLYKKLLNSLSLKTTSVYNPVIPSYAHSDIFDADVATIRPQSTASHSVLVPQTSSILPHLVHTNRATVTVTPQVIVTLVPVYNITDKTTYIPTTELKTTRYLQHGTTIPGTTNFQTYNVPSTSTLRNKITTIGSKVTEQKHIKYSEPDPLYHNKQTTNINHVHHTSKAPITTITYFSPTNTDDENDVSTPRATTKKMIRVTTRKTTPRDDEYLDIFGESPNIATKKPAAKVQNNQLPKPDNEVGTTTSYRHNTVTLLQKTEPTTEELKATVLGNTESVQYYTEDGTTLQSTPVGTSTHKFRDTSETPDSSELLPSTHEVTTGALITHPVFYSTPQNYYETETTKSDTTTTRRNRFTNKQPETSTRDIHLIEKESSTYATSTAQYNNQKTFTDTEIASTSKLNNEITTQITSTTKQATPVETIIYPTTRNPVSTTYTQQRTTKINTKPSTQKTIDSFHQDTILADIFGEEEHDDVIDKPVTASTPQYIQHEDEFLFGTQSADSTTQSTKVIFDNFFIPSATSPTSEESDSYTPATDDTATPKSFGATLTTEKHDEAIPRTSLSYVTSISYHVDEENNTEAQPMPLTTTKYEPTIKAKISEMSTSDYKIFKAELPETTSAVEPVVEVSKSNTKKEFDNLALSLINHARSIDILNNRTKRTKYKRRRYRPTVKN